LGERELVKPLPSSDFRANRFILEPQDFLEGPEEPDPPPSDLIDEDTWYGINLLPDDVSVRISSHHGGLLKIVYQLWGAWIEAVGSDQDQLYDTILDAADEFQAATFNSLHGYYRQSIDCLRDALEVVAIGTYCQVCGRIADFKQWRVGQAKISFGDACDGLSHASSVEPLTSHLKATLEDSIFDQKDHKTSYPGGWARRLYSELSDYAHSRPGFTNVDMWLSNGPIYVPNAFVSTAAMSFQTSALCYILVKLGRPNFTLPESALQLFGPDRILPMKIAYVAYMYLFQDKAQDRT
jgi:hypothetical protein